MKNQQLKFAALSAVAALGFAACGSANAAVVYSYVTDQNSYNASGPTVTVNLYLKETLTDGSTSFLATDNGLSAFAVLVKQSANGLPPSASFISSVATDATDFPLFNGPSTSFKSAAGDRAQLGGSIDVAATMGVEPGNVGGTVAGNTVASPSIANEIFLGHIVVTVGQGVTTFTVGALDPVNGTNTVTKANVFDLDTGLDGDGNPVTSYTGVGTTTTSFTVSPEPASLGVFAVGGLLALRRRRV